MNKVLKVFPFLNVKLISWKEANLLSSPRNLRGSIHRNDTIVTPFGVYELCQSKMWNCEVYLQLNILLNNSKSAVYLQKLYIQVQYSKFKLLDEVSRCMFLSQKLVSSYQNFDMNNSDFDFCKYSSLIYSKFIKYYC